MSEPRDPGQITRTGSQEREYLLRRANDHLELADRCGEPGPRLIHQRLRQLYEEQAELVGMVLPD